MKSGRTAGAARDAQIAQLVEQRTENPRVAGSIPALGTGEADDDYNHIVIISFFFMQKSILLLFRRNIGKMTDHGQ